MLAHVYNPRYLGSRSKAQGLQPAQGQELSRSVSKNKLGMVVHTYNPIYTGGIDSRIMAQEAKSSRLYLKND
jgi:hypothetical protein